MEETILIAISKWAVKNLNIVGALKNVGTEVLEKIVWTPLKDKIINFFESDKEIIMMNPNGDTLIKKVSELCPYPFTEENL